MSRISDIEQGVVRIIPIDPNPPDIVPVESIPCKILHIGKDFTDVATDGEMEISDLLKVCGYKAGYIMDGYPVARGKKFIYEVRRGIPRLDE